jgi:hypothetical protein
MQKTATAQLFDEERPINIVIGLNHIPPVAKHDMFASVCSPAFYLSISICLSV